MALRPKWSLSDRELNDERFKDKLVRWLVKADQNIEEVLAGSSTATGGGTGGTILVTSSSDYLEIPNTIGLAPGEFINIDSGGTISRADYRTKPATHCVGSATGTLAKVYKDWASGGCLLSGVGSGEVLFLGTNGTAQLEMPGRSSDGGSYYQQPLGRRLASFTSGLVECSLAVADLPRMM